MNRRSFFKGALLGASVLAVSACADMGMMSSASSNTIVDVAAANGSFTTLVAAVQAAGLRGLNEGQKVSYEVAMERGKAAATNLKLA